MEKLSPNVENLDRKGETACRGLGQPVVVVIIGGVSISY